ncbi:hypothetical protein LJE86_04995 [bacterium BMS3Abin03]|nr:hypothetical protein [bacterium BMS3Abin03]MCG6960603.1 hypothetical protein [bacterium BMS3Abin03]
MKNNKVSKKKRQTFIRILAAIVIGLMNTVLIRREDVRSRENYVGYLFLIIAAIDLFYLLLMSFKQSKKNE